MAEENNNPLEYFTQKAKDEYGVIFDINDIQDHQHKMYHLLDGSLLENVLGGPIRSTKFFRRKKDSKNSGGSPEESTLHKFIKHMFDPENIDAIKELGICGVLTSLTNGATEQRISIRKKISDLKNIEIKSYTPDVSFDECVIEVVITSELKLEKRMFYEGIGKPIIIVDYSKDAAHWSDIMDTYYNMSVEEIKEDIINRAYQVEKYNDYIIIPYVSKLKEKEEELIFLKKELGISTINHRDLLLLRDDNGIEIERLSESVEELNIYNSRIKEENIKLRETLGNKESDYFAAQSIIDSLSQQNKELSKINDNKPLLDKIESQKEVIANQVGKVADFHMFLMEKPELLKEWKRKNNQTNGIR